jgi:multifunctional methyltransferase subunit TRM112
LPATAPTRDDLVVGGEKSPTTQPPQREAPETDAVAEAEEAEAAQEEEAEEQPTQTARDLHRLLLETCVQEGKLVCGCCGHEYKVLEGVANFLLPGHLV